MSYLEYAVKSTPSGFRKFLYMNWPLTLLLISTASAGFLMLYSVAGGSWLPWAEPQMERFGLGLTVMFIVALVPIWFWRNMSVVAYLGSIALLVFVELFGTIGMGAQRWIDLGFMRLQPSEVMKVTLVMLLAAYYDWLPSHKTSRPLWVIIPVILILIPTFMVLRQPDLGTSILLLAAGGGLMFLAGVHWAYFAAVIAAVVGLDRHCVQQPGNRVAVAEGLPVPPHRHVSLDPSTDPLGAGYHITQSKIALGSGGWNGRGFMQGTQSRLNFLPEKAHRFHLHHAGRRVRLCRRYHPAGAVWLILIFCLVTALSTKDRFSSLVTLGIALNFFLFFAVNMSMVMGLAPVVGVPLPMVSYGGSAMLVLMAAFGIVQSAHIHRPR